MTLFMKNMEFFKEKAPAVHDILTREEALNSFTIEPSADAAHNYVLEGDSVRCFIHSIYDIQREMKAMFSHLDPETEVLILLGFGTGYGLQFIQEHFQRIKHVIVVEPILPLFKQVLQKEDIKKLIAGVKELTLVLNQDVEEAVGIVTRSIVRQHNQTLDLAYHFSYRSLLKGYYERFHTSFVQHLQQSRKGIAARDAVKKKWPAHVFQNMGIQHLPAHRLFEEIARRPVVLLTGGYSLAEKLALVEEIKERAIVLSSGPAIHLLHEKGLSPHLRFCPRLTSQTQFFDDTETDPVPLIYSDHLPSQILSAYWGQKIKVILGSDVLTQYIYHRGGIPFWPLNEEPSFINGLVELLCQSGVQRLILLDLDLCTEEEMESTPLKVLDKQGAEVFTNGYLLRIKRSLEQQVAVNGSVSFITDREKGLQIQNSRAASLQEILEALKEEPPLGDFLAETLEKLVPEMEEYRERLDAGIKGVEEDLNLLLLENKKWLKDIKKMRRYRERNLGVQRILKEYRHMESHWEGLKKNPFYQEVMMKMLGDTFLSIISTAQYQGDDKQKLVESMEKKQTGIAVENEVYGDYLLSLIKDHQEEKELDFEF